MVITDTAPAADFTSAGSFGPVAVPGTQSVSPRLLEPLGDDISSLQIAVGKQVASSIVDVSLSAFASLGRDAKAPPMIAVTIRSSAAAPAPALASESHTVSDTLTTNNGTLFIGSDLQGRVTYHGAFGSLVLVLAASQVTNRRQPRIVSSALDSCTGRTVAGITQPATTISSGTLAATGTVTLHSAAAERYAFTRHDQGTISVGRRSR